MSDYCIRKTKCVTEKMSSILYLLSRGTCCPPVHVDVCPPSVCRARSRSQRKTPPCVWPAQTSLAALSDLMRKSHHSCGKKESFTRWCWHSSGANQSPTYAKKNKKESCFRYFLLRWGFRDNNESRMQITVEALLEGQGHTVWNSTQISINFQKEDLPPYQLLLSLWIIYLLLK